MRAVASALENWFQMQIKDAGCVKLITVLLIPGLHAFFLPYSPFGCQLCSRGLYLGCGSGMGCGMSSGWGSGMMLNPMMGMGYSSYAMGYPPFGLGGYGKYRL